jgi:hypothetical protein
LSAAPAVTKMIGMWRARSLPRMNSASSKPSMPGIWTSSKRQRDLVHQKQFQRLFARAGLETGQALALKQGFERQQVLFEVIDEQEVDRLFRDHHAAPKLDR